MDGIWAKENGVPSEPLREPMRTLDGSPLGSGLVIRVTTILRLSVSQHQEVMNFHLIPCTEFPLILGYHWLYSHNPHID